MEKSVFHTLFNVNVNNHIEKKNGLTYLSWTYAWAEVKKKYPKARYTIYENLKGYFYHTDGITCWVKTGVTIDGLEYIEYLPVMDYRNKSIFLDNVTSVDINKAIQRSLTKTLARHGLGLYIYAGEDLPELETEKITIDEVKILKQIIGTKDNSDKLYQNIKKSFCINNLMELNKKQYTEIVQKIKCTQIKREGDKND